MDEAAPQAAGGMTADEISKALGALQLLYGHPYKFGYDAEPGWWVIKDGNVGWILTAASPTELARKVEDAEGAGKAGACS
jgi:hypothetical protein